MDELAFLDDLLNDDQAVQWQLDLRRAPIWVESPHPPHRPWIAVAVDGSDQRVAASDLVSTEEMDAESMLCKALASLAALSPPPKRPTTVVLGPGARLPGIQRLLLDRGIELEFSQVWGVDHFLSATEKKFAGDESIDGYLVVKGVELELIEDFASAVAEFTRSEPWKELDGDADPIRVVTPESPELSARAVSVMGAAGEVYGLTFASSVDDYLSGFDDWVERCRDSTGQWVLLLEDGPSIPIADHDTWLDHDLEVVDSKAYPFLVRMGPKRRIRRPGRRFLVWVTAVLRAIARATDAELCEGRWSKEVDAGGELRKVVLEISSICEARDDPDRFLARCAERFAADLDTTGSGTEGPKVEKIIDDMMAKPRARAMVLAGVSTHLPGRLARHAAEMAVELDPEDPTTWTSLAVSRAPGRGLVAAEKALELELELENQDEDPSRLAMCHWEVARHGSSLGQTDMAIDHLQLAMNTGDPLAEPFAAPLAILAIGEDRATRLDSDFFERRDRSEPFWAWAEVLWLFAIGDDDDALVASTRALAKAPDVPSTLAFGEPPVDSAEIADLQRIWGRVEPARKWLEDWTRAQG